MSLDQDPDEAESPASTHDEFWEDLARFVCLGRYPELVRMVTIWLMVIVLIYAVYRLLS